MCANELRKPIFRLIDVISIYDCLHDLHDQVCGYACRYVYVSINIYIYICMCVWLIYSICQSMCESIRMNISIYTHQYVSMCVYVLFRLCHICTYTYVDMTLGRSYLHVFTDCANASCLSHIPGFKMSTLAAAAAAAPPVRSR